MKERSQSETLFWLPGYFRFVLRLCENSVRYFMIERRVVSYYFFSSLYPYHVTLVRVNYEISRHNFPLRSFHTACPTSRQKAVPDATGR